MTPVTAIAPMTDRLFERLAVVGAGNMGSGIAQKTASEGFPTLVDLDDHKVARGLGIIEKTLQDGVHARSSGGRRCGDPRAARGTSRFVDLADADLVVEAVFEDLASTRASSSASSRSAVPTRSSRRTRLRSPSLIWPPR